MAVVLYEWVTCTTGSSSKWVSSRGFLLQIDKMRARKSRLCFGAATWWRLVDDGVVYCSSRSLDSRDVYTLCVCTALTRSVDAVDLWDLKAETDHGRRALITRRRRRRCPTKYHHVRIRSTYGPASLSLSPVTYCHTGAATVAPPSTTLVSAAHVTTATRS